MGLIVPMLFVSDDIKPGWLVQQVFKHILRRLLPTWPITPSKNLDQFMFRDPEQGPAWMAVNPCRYGVPPRLSTAYELAFRFPDWVEAKLKELRTPFIVMHGTSDFITDPSLSEKLYAEAVCSD